eukprot:3028714-Prymnesium_polylepis.1
MHAQARLKATLREKLPVLTAEMAADVTVNLDEGWLTEGHAYVGQRVTRIFDKYGVVSTGVINRWLPADEDAGDGAARAGGGGTQRVGEGGFAAAVAALARGVEASGGHAEGVRESTVRVGCVRQARCSTCSTTAMATRRTWKRTRRARQSRCTRSRR